MKRLKIILCLLAAAAVAFAGLWLVCRIGASQAPADDKKTLRVALWDYETVSYDRRLIEEFEAQNPDVRIEVISYSPLYYSFGLEALLEGGEPVDVIYINQLTQFSQLYPRDIYLPLDRFIARDQVDLSCYLNTGVLRSPESGELLALPYRQDKFLLYYNKDLFDAAGIAYPSAAPTWDEVCALAVQLSGQGQYGLFLSAQPEHLLAQAQDEPFDFLRDSMETLRDGLVRFQALDAAGACMSFTDTNQKDLSQQLFETGAFGMFLNGSWYLNFLATDTAQGLCTFRWGVTERPGAGGAPVNDVQLTPICIHRDTRDPETAWRFVRFVCGEEGARILAEEMTIPAYHSPEIDRLITDTAEGFELSPSVLLSGFAQPCAPASSVENKVRESVYKHYQRALLGLESVEDCLRQAAQERDSIMQ